MTAQKASGFLPIARDKVLVRGAKHTVLIDFDAGQLLQVDDHALLEKENESADAPETHRRELDSPIFYTAPVGIVPSVPTGCTLPSPEPACGSDEADVGSPELDSLWIEVTSRCNLRCVHCYADSEPGGERGLPVGILEEVINQAAELGCRAVQFTGGECLLREDLPTLIEHALARGITLIEVFTNGTLLREDTIKFFHRKGIHVAISLHSYRAGVHDAITGVIGSFDKTMNALKLLLAYGVPTRCAIVAMKQNESDLLLTSYFLSQLGVFSRLPDPIRPGGRGIPSEYWPEEYGERFFLTQPHFPVSREDFTNNCRGNSCWRGKAAVTSSGSVIPCIFARDQITGYVPRQSLRQILSGEEMQSYWSLTKDKVETCGVCEYRYLCTDCRALAVGLTGNLYAKSPRCTYNPIAGTWGPLEYPLPFQIQSCSDCSARKRCLS